MSMLAENGVSRGRVEAGAGAEEVIGKWHSPTRQYMDRECRMYRQHLVR